MFELTLQALRLHNRHQWFVSQQPLLHWSTAWLGLLPSPLPHMLPEVPVHEGIMVAGPSSVSRWTSGDYLTWVGYLAQENKSLFILWWTSPVSWVLPVQVKSIKPVSSQELNGGLHECISVGLCRHHLSESVKRPRKEQRSKENI